MPLWKTIFKPGLHTRGTGKGKIEYEGTADLNLVGLTDEDVEYFNKMGRVIWSDHPTVQYRLALGQWKQRRREAAARGKPVPNEPMPEPEDFRRGYIAVPAPGALPAGTYVPLQEGEYEVDQTGAPKNVPQQQTSAPQQAEDTPDPKIGALRARFMRYNYASLESFAEKVGEDPNYIREIGANWPAEKGR